MTTFEIKMPKLGESITEGTIVAWNVKEGDVIKEEDVIFEVNTAKVSAEIPSPVAGKVIEILAREGDTVAVGVVVAVIALEDDDNESVDMISDQKPDNEPVAKSVTASVDAAPTIAAPADTPALSGRSDERWYSPAVVSKAKEAGIGSEELDAVHGTGYLGRVTKKDVERYVENGKINSPVPRPPASTESAPPAASKTVVSSDSFDEDKVVPMDAVRKIIADRMVASKRISPHVTTVVEVDMSKLARWREKNKEAFRQREGVALTFLPAIAEATVKALGDFPRLNASVDGYNIIEKKRINLGIAVSLSDGNLIVPVIKDADKLNIPGLAAAINTVAVKARANKLMPGDIQGGTFTITNFGSFKNLFGTPIINQPEVAILGVGVVEKRPSVIESPDGDMIAVRHKMYLSLSYDHRAVDGSLGGSFLRRIADYLEDWNE